MFEAALLNKLKSDGALAGYLSVYEGAPSMFSDLAPDGAVEPYLVFNITRMGDDNVGAMAFNIFVDLFDRDVSRAHLRAATERVEFLLDQAILSDSSNRYDTIRLFFYSGGPIPEGDSRKVHYNLQFTARAGRKAWAAQLT